MSTKKQRWFGPLIAGLLLLALSIGPQAVGAAQVQSADQVETEGSVQIAYPGYLENGAGQPASGVYTFAFALYTAEVGGEALWSEVQENVPVSAGKFSLSLGSVTQIPQAVFAGGEHWLETSVRGPGEAGFVTLQPRQRVNASQPSTLNAPTANGGCPHDHWNEDWSGTGTGLFLNSSDNYGLMARGHPAIYAESGAYQIPLPTGGNIAIYGYAADIGVYGFGNNFGVGGVSDSGVGVRGSSTTGDGVEGFTVAGNKSGVYGHSVDGNGVTGTSTARNGIHGLSISEAGVKGTSQNGAGVLGESSTSNGVVGESTSPYYGGGWFHNESGGIGLIVEGSGAGSAYAALRVTSNNFVNGIAAYFINASDYPTAEFDQNGAGAVLDLQNGGDDGGAGGGDFIAAYSANVELQFKVASSGEVHSDVGYFTPAADFAEMLPAVAGLEPGDVLVIGPDGMLTLSTGAYQTSVVGVYSTQPGFVGGSPMAGPISGTIPLAIVGVVPVKVSAENGPIQPGDLLVTSATPGYAMRAGDNPPQGTVIGKALAPLETRFAVILILVTLQ